MKRQEWKLFLSTLIVLLVLSACSLRADVKKAPQGEHPAHDHASHQIKDIHPTVSAMVQQGVHVVADPDSILVLVNKHFKLPDNYQPHLLVYPKVRFLGGHTEKAKMRLVAANALEKMFRAAAKDGIPLVGVSAYRSSRAQTALFNRYVARDGKTKALTYSALPGTSEHETGLAIDVSGAGGQGAATTAFAGTKESNWLEKHAQDYGYIIRYPKGKEAVTGYEYEPWHLRYVGPTVAKAIKENDQTLEEYLGEVPVTK